MNVQGQTFHTGNGNNTIFNQCSWRTLLDNTSKFFKKQLSLCFQTKEVLVASFQESGS
jgi:hypothetical protein